MPSQLTIFPERNLAYLHYAGRTTATQCLGTSRTLRDHPLRRKVQGWLVDFSALEGFGSDFDEMRAAVQQVALQHDGQPPDTPLAIYAPSDLGFGVGRMYQQICAGLLPMRIGVFREADRALAHLGQPEVELAAFLAKAR
ncbi:hypothetical protein ACFSDD_11335 [Salipiger marinus]|uniref:hypothetical protein n=1 Tax=Salipiger marinus TaxID=555512 RepID=UPI002CF5A918|nr:hypothetical protein [Salipiger manganoxidans]MEB3419963.1 hypothetical protein [Salipiger manganoxidans]